MLEPLRNPVNWDNFRKVAVLVLILSAAASVLFGIIYFFILGEGRSPAPANIFRALILLLVLVPGSPAGSRRGLGTRMKGQQYVDNHAFESKGVGRRSGLPRRRFPLYGPDCRTKLLG